MECARPDERDYMKCLKDCGGKEIYIRINWEAASSLTKKKGRKLLPSQDPWGKKKGICTQQVGKLEIAFQHSRCKVVQ